MAFCRSRKTGNCSAYFQNRLLQEKVPETFSESFPIPGSPAFAAAKGGVSSTHGNREAPVWHRSGKPFLDGACGCRTWLAQRTAGH